MLGGFAVGFIPDQNVSGFYFGRLFAEQIVLFSFLEMGGYGAILFDDVDLAKVVIDEAGAVHTEDCVVVDVVLKRGDGCSLECDGVHECECVVVWEAFPVKSF